MRYISFGKHLKDLRKKKGISQMTVAEWLTISNVTVSRIESGEKLPSYSQYTTLMQKLGEYSEDYLMLLLENNELYGYQKMTELRQALRDGKLKAAQLLVAEVDGVPPFDSGLYLQFLMYAKVMTSENIEFDESMETLISALKLTIHNFSIEKVAEYRLSYNEITIIGELAARHYDIDDRKTAIAILRAIKKSMDEHYINEDEKATTYPVLLYNIAKYIGQEGYHEEVIELCRLAKKMAIIHNRQSIVPYLLAMSATAKRNISNIRGGQEDMNEAFFTARAMEDYSLAETIKKDAEDNFGIRLNYITL